jgi:hypothetical protein
VGVVVSYVIDSSLLGYTGTDGAPPFYSIYSAFIASCYAFFASYSAFAAASNAAIAADDKPAYGLLAPIIYSPSCKIGAETGRVASFVPLPILAITINPP